MTPQPPLPPKRVAYTPAQFAEAIGITEPAVRRYIREGLLAAKKVGGRWFIPASEADRMFETGDSTQERTA
jgi:excisionase family DNA binding protein